MSALASFDELITESEVCRKYSHLLSERELRLARQHKQISFVTGKKGMILYHPVGIAEYLERKVTPSCQQLQHHVVSGSTANIGSSALPTAITSMPAGGTSEQNEHVAAVLTRKFLAKRESV